MVRNLLGRKGYGRVEKGEEQGRVGGRRVGKGKNVLGKIEQYIKKKKRVSLKCWGDDFFDRGFRVQGACGEREVKGDG